jgi:isoleucyl-tRNA synthetase
MSDNKEQRPEAEKNVFAVMEEEVQSFWEKSKTFEKSVNREAPQGDYVFYDGPPFITGMPHYATLLPSIAKDMIPRYQTMKGHRVERIWGWDCHGLPAENKVEGELGLKNKQDIETLGVDKFVAACRNYVNTGSEQWRWYIDRIARWADMDNSYRTMDKDFMESVIWAFKKLYDKGLIYEGYRTSLHCPRCATPLSKFEITMDAGSYRDVTEASVVVEFKVISGKFKDAFILAWTTTPWTLPGNLALAVGANIDYVLIEKKDQGEGELVRFILAKELLEKHFEGQEYQILEELKGTDLVAQAYEPLFDLGNEEIKANANAYKVYAADFVSTEDGTGVVHIAPNFGEDDFNVGKAVDLPMIDLMDETGTYLPASGSDFQGLYYKKAGKLVLEKIADKIFSVADHTHSYPFCYRCSTPLIYKTQKAWYLRISDIRARMLELNQKINWQPAYFKDGRFQTNLETAPDWCLSRSRYWGSPIPVWKCEACEAIKVAGSIAEIEELSGGKVADLHRPEIDAPEFACACGGKMRRVKEVFDCWFESGAMPFAQFHYPFNPKYPENTEGERPNFPFPADFIIEYTGQLRGWFYYLHVLSTALFDDVAFKNVIVSGVLAGTDGRKMSKSYGNYPDPRNTLHKYGADALRLYFMSSPLMMGGDSNFIEKDVQDALRKNIMILWNVVKFYTMFNPEPWLSDECPESDNILDKWILIQLAELHRAVTFGLEAYDLPAASSQLTSFIDALSTWYIRRSRDRFKGEDEKEIRQANETTAYVLLQFSKIIAPIMPFMAERIWQTIGGNNFNDADRSVHLESWPEIKIPDSVYSDKEILAKMDAVRKFVEIGLAKRDELGLKIRQPLNSFKVRSENIDSILIKDDENFLDLIKDELNVRNVVFEKAEVAIDCELDTEITPELKAEGIKRELVRTINAMRKNMGLTIEDRVKIYFAAEGVLAEVFSTFSEELKKDTLASELIAEKKEEGKELTIEGESLTLYLLKN